jgi:uncharacterized membrane protein HdeD (DUF308 family)
MYFHKKKSIMLAKKVLEVLFTLVLFGIGGLLSAHFIAITSIVEIQFLPIYIMVLCLCYVIVQIVKRYALNNQNWWDWLYYIGLLSIMVPAYMINEENSTLSIGLANYGTLFLLIPVIGDALQIFQKK